MADNAAQSIKDLSKDVEILDQRIAKSIELLQGFDKGIADLFEEARKQGIANTDQLVDYLAKKLNNLQIKTVVSPFLGAFDEKEIDKAAKRYAALLEKQDVVEKARSIAVGGRKFGELQGEDLKNWREFGALLANINEQKRQIEQATPGSAEAGRKLYNEQLAFQKAQEMQSQERKRIAQEEANVKRKAAEDEKQLVQEIKEEERKAKEEALQRYKEEKAYADDVEKRRHKTKERELNEAFGQQSKQRLEAEKRMNQAIQQQIQYYRQLHTLYKGYKDLQAKPNKTKEDIAILEQTKQKILEILRLSKQLELENKGSRQSGINATNFQRLADNLRNASKETKTLKANLNNLLPTLQRLASAFGIAFSVRGLAQFGKKLIETRGEFERQQVALRSILQNKQLADEIWDKTMQAALQSPFTAMQLTTYTKQLAAYRIETDKLFDTTKRLADVSAGLGVDMQRLILAYGQVKAANYLRASEIRQFTEAGVNILGELSRYFSETRNQMYSTAQVMEMVTKRMVKFEDVEAIFKRMTDQGGIFYEMQYVQSQTVRGQIAKLHDAYDQMLNSIGKANQGTLRALVGLLNNIVKNWREWKTVFDSIMWPLLITSVYKFGRGLFYANAGAIAMNKNVNALTRAGARLNLTFKKLNATIAANPWMLLAEVLVVAGTAIWNHAKAVREVNKEYDEMNGRLLETQYRMTSYEDKIKKNNAIIKDSTKSTKEQKEAQDENKKILSELQRDYPDVAASMAIANNGVVTMTNSMKEYNAQLRLQILLNERAKAGFFNQSLKKDAPQFDEAIQKQQLELAKYTNQAQRVASIIQNGIETNKIKAEEFGEVLASVLQMASSISVEEYEKAFNEFQNIRVKGDFASSALERELSTLGIGGSKFYFKSIAESHKLKSTRAEVMDEIKDDYKFFGDYLTTMTKMSENFTGEMALTSEEFIKKNGNIIQSMLYTIKDDGTVVMGELGYALSQAFADAASVAQTEQGAQEIVDEYIRQFKENYGLDVKFGLKQKKEETTYDPAAEEKLLSEWRQRIKLIEDMNKKYKELSKSVYGYAKSEQKVREAFQTAWKEANMPFSMESIDFTSDKAVADALAMFRGKIPQKLLSELEKTISERESTIELDVQVRIREDFGKQMEKAFGDYELTLELDKLNISPEAAKNLFPEFDSQTLGELQDAMQEFYEKQGASFDEEDLKAYKQWSDKIDAEILKSRKEKAKEYSKYLEKEYSERAKVEMQYAKDVAFVTANFNGEQQKNILKGIEDKYQKDINELTWKSFKESAFYVEMMDDLSSVPADYMKIMLDKIEELLAHPETLSPRALKEAINARQKILEAQMDINSISVMRESLKEMRDAATDVGGKTWAQTKKRLDEEQTAQAEKLKGLEEEIRCYEELQGQLKGLEQHDEAVATANRALPEDVISMLENTDVDTLIGQYSDELDSLLVSEDAATSAEKDANAEIQARIEYLQRIIPLLESYRTALNERAAYQATDAGENALFARNGGETSSSVGETINEYKKEADEVSNRLSELKKWQKAFKNFSDGMAKWNGAVADAITKVGAMGDAFYDTFDALGGETNALTEGWKEFGDTMVQTITQALTLIPQLVAGFIAAGTSINAAMGLIGLIAEAVQLILVAVGAVAKLHDARYEREIEIQQKKIDDLQRAYDRLEKSIEKTFDTVSYMREYNQEVQNLNEQYEALAKQIDAEKAKKNVDEDKLQDYADKQQEIIDNLEEIKQQQIEAFGGIGEDNYRSAAEGFVDAWKSAFLETGDGLQGLQDHFDEFLNDWFVKQATMRVAGRMLEPLFRQIDSAVDQYSNGGANVLMQELQNVREKFGVLAPQLSEALEELAGMWGLQGEGGLSGLAAGIQGMTEEQANILEAYWNSVRGYTASIDMNVARIVDMMVANYGEGRSVESNPMLQQLNLIAANTAATHTILQSVTKSGHTMGGSGIKVFLN